MSDSRLRQVFNQAVTDVSFRNEFLGNIRKVLLEYGIKEEVVCFIEAREPRDIQALARVLEDLESQFG